MDYKYLHVPLSRPDFSLFSDSSVAMDGVRNTAGERTSLAKSVILPAFQVVIGS
jgi:hypothetical protein